VEKLLEIKQGINLADMTTLGVGGPARFFASAETEKQIVEAVRFARDSSLKLFVLGGGSNALIADRGFNGLVLHIALKGIVRGEDAPIRVTAQAGEDWDEFVAFCVKDRLAGIECLSGIPGSVGGTPVQNVGAYGQEVAETIDSVRCFDRTTNEFVTLSNADCRFSYRKSIFNTDERNRYIVTAVTFGLTENGSPKVEYPELRRVIESLRGEKATEGPTVEEIRDHVLRIRRAKSMVIDPDDPNAKSAGSFFKNPLLSGPKFDELLAAYPQMPYFPFGKANKIPAAWLIENAGFEKGFSMGNAGISTRHTLALINRGGASAKELVALKEIVETAVFDKFGIQLVPEPVFVGF